MKIRNRIISLVMLAVMLFTMAIPTFAQDNAITPYYNNTASTETVFVIDENGVASISYTCMGYRNITTSISVEMKIQKKTWWWWNDVDGTYWTDSSNTYYCSNAHSVQLNQGGTYKAVVTYTVYGSGGEADVINSEVEKSY
ncbi:MAG: hypothetical protein J6B34_02195 [Clostridia bacterium]|nr:hypothetical protein [Clostridia bacterium]